MDPQVCEQQDSSQVSNMTPPPEYQTVASKPRSRIARKPVKVEGVTQRMQGMTLAERAVFRHAARAQQAEQSTSNNDVASSVGLVPSFRAATQTNTLSNYDSTVCGELDANQAAHALNQYASVNEYTTPDAGVTNSNGLNTLQAEYAAIPNQMDLFTPNAGVPDNNGLTALQAEYAAITNQIGFTEDEFVQVANNLHADTTTVPEAMRPHLVHTPTTTTDTIFPMNTNNGVIHNNTPELEASVALDPINPGEPDYNPAILDAMRASPDIGMDIWIGIYRTHVRNHIATLTAFLYGSRSCSTTILGSKQEPTFRAQIAYLQAELVKVNAKYRAIHGPLGDRMRAEKRRKEATAAKKLQEEKEVERRMSEAEWRRMEVERLEVDRRFHEERVCAKLACAELARASKELEAQKTEEARKAIEEAEAELAEEARIAAIQIEKDAEAKRLQQEFDEAMARYKAERQSANEGIRKYKEALSKAEANEYETVRARWEWMMKDMQERQLAEVRAAQAEQQLAGAEHVQRQRFLKRGFSQCVMDFDYYHQIRAEERPSKRPEDMVQEVTSVKRSKIGSVGNMWKVLKCGKK